MTPASQSIPHPFCYDTAGMLNEKKRLLVIDDDEDFQNLVANLFAAEFESLAASDGETGFTLAREHKPDLILLDVILPRLPGFLLLRKLQAAAELRRIPVVMISAGVMHPSIIDLLRQERNVRAYIQKPCGIDELRQSVLQAVAGV